MTQVLTLMILLTLLTDYTPEKQRLFLKSNGLEFTFVAYFKTEDTQLSFVAAEHVSGFDNQTYNKIEEVFNSFDLECVIVEGYDDSWGQEKFAAHYKKIKTQDSKSHGEPQYTIKLAIERGAHIYGGEPTQKEIYEQLNFCIL